MATIQVPKLTPEQRSRRARIAATTRHKPDAAASELHNFRVDRLADHIQSIVEVAPLTEIQRDRLAALLQPLGGAA